MTHLKLYTLNHHTVVHDFIGLLVYWFIGLLVYWFIDISRFLKLHEFFESLTSFKSFESSNFACFWMSICFFM
jgi:hypothetical protein